MSSYKEVIDACLKDLGSLQTRLEELRDRMGEESDAEQEEQEASYIPQDYGRDYPISRDVAERAHREMAFWDREARATNSRKHHGIPIELKGDGMLLSGWIITDAETSLQTATMRFDTVSCLGIHYGLRKLLFARESEKDLHKAIPKWVLTLKASYAHSIMKASTCRSFMRKYQQPVVVDFPSSGMTRNATVRFTFHPVMPAVSLHTSETSTQLSDTGNNVPENGSQDTDELGLLQALLVFNEFEQELE